MIDGTSNADQALDVENTVFTAQSSTQELATAMHSEHSQPPSPFLGDPEKPRAYTLKERDDFEQRAVASSPSGPPEDEPPDGGYGWVCVICVTLINAHTWGINSQYGIFLAHYLSSGLFPSATAIDYAFIGGLSVSMALIVSPLATYMTRRVSTRATLLVGVFFQTVSLLGASWATQTWHLFLSQGICFGWGMGMLFVASVGVPAQWFKRRRSLANGIAAGGSGIGGLIWGLAIDAMIQSVGLAWTFRILAIVSGVVNALAAVLTKDRNRQIGTSQRMFDYRLFMSGEYLLLLGWGFFSMLGYIVVLYSIPSYASTVGLTAKQGSILSALLSLGMGLGRPVVGHYSDAFGRLNMSTLLTFLSGLLCFVVWIFAKNFGVLIFLVLVGGTVFGTFWATVSPVTAEVVGLQELPSALSIIWIVVAVPCTFAEPIALQLRSSSGDVYLRCQIFTGFMYIGAAICLWLLRASKLGHLERPAILTKAVEAGEEELKPRLSYLARLFAWKKV